MMVVREGKAHLVRDVGSSRIFGRFLKLRLRNVRGIDVNSVAARQMNGSGAGSTGYLEDPLSRGEFGRARHVVFGTLLGPGQRLIGLSE